MDDYEREMEIIALLSNIDENYTYMNVDNETIEHHCAKTGENRAIKLIEVEYFKEAGIREDRANFCDKCNQVFVYKPSGQ